MEKNDRFFLQSANEVGFVLFRCVTLDEQHRNSTILDIIIIFFSLNFSFFFSSPLPINTIFVTLFLYGLTKKKKTFHFLRQPISGTATKITSQTDVLDIDFDI